MESKAYSWEWITASQMLTDKECELVYAYLVPKGAETGTILYDGENAGGRQIVTLVSSSVDGKEFSPAVPVYCRKGLYITIGGQTTGILVVYRNL